MSCVNGIPIKMTPEQVAEAERQKFAYSSPPPRKSLQRRLRRMAQSADYRIRERAALDYDLPLDMQKYLAGDHEKSVRMCLARNPNTSSEVLTALSGDTDSTVRALAAYHNNTPTKVIRYLSLQDDDSGVRAVARVVLANFR